MRKDNWASLHERAWTKVLDHLALRPAPIEESDLDDTSELTVATVYYVLYLAYEQAHMMGDAAQKAAERYYDKFIKEMAEVRLTVDGAEQPRSCYRFRRAARA
jgi:hypothetical protein